MKKLILTLCCFISMSLYGQAPQLEWAVQQGGSLSDRGFSIATDTFGNVYNTGSFSNNALLSDTADFDSGPGFYGLFSNGDADIFVSKLSPDGDLLWAVSFGSDEGDRGFGIATDVSGNVYVTGQFSGEVDFDPGSEVFTLLSESDYSDIFVLKLSMNGSFIWAKQLGGGGNSVSGSSIAYSIALDTDGNVYTTGRASDGVDFDPGPGEFPLTSNTNSASVFISKLDNDGNFVWAKAIGGEGLEFSNAIALDQFNNVFITGNFQDIIDFDPNSDTHTLSAIGGGDLYILKLNSEGGFIWAKNIGGVSAGAEGKDITIDPLGNVYTTGIFFEDVDFDPGAGVYELSAVEKDIFILKLDINGDFVWAKSIGGNDFYDCGNAITLDEYNNIYTTGIFQDTIDFDTGPETYNLLSSEGGGYVLKLDTDGSFVWAVAFPSNDENYPGEFNEGGGIAVDQSNNVYTTGRFWRTTDFNPSDSIVYSLTSYGTTDIFIQKMSQPCNASLSIYSNTLTICNQESVNLNAVFPATIQGGSYLWNTGNITDSIVVSPESNTTYTLSVNYVDGNVLCSLSDSVAITVLEKPDTSYLSFVTCDSIEAGVFELVYSAHNGCDSIVIETNSFLSIPEIPVIQTNLVISSNAPPFEIMIPEISNATGYLWTVPVGVEILSGAGTNTIIVDWDNQIINDSVCVSAINDCGSSMSACLEVTVDFTDAVEDVQNKNYRIFPNPTADLLNIVFDNENYYEITLLDFLGRQLFRINEANGYTILPTKNLPSGTYWLKIINIDATFEDDWHLEKIEVQK